MPCKVSPNTKVSPFSGDTLNRCSVRDTVKVSLNTYPTLPLYMERRFWGWGCRPPGDRLTPLPKRRATKALRCHQEFGDTLVTGDTYSK